MNFARLGLVLVAIGAIPLIMFAVTSVNPNVTLADAGLVSALGGASSSVSAFFRGEELAPNTAISSSLLDGGSRQSDCW